MKRIFYTATLAILLCICQNVISDELISSEDSDPESDHLELEVSFVDTPVAQAFEMLSQLGRTSIILNSGVTGTVTAQLFEHSIDDAIRIIAEAAGYTVEKRDNVYVVLDRDEVGKNSLGDMTDVKSFKVQYIDPKKAAALLEKYLSRYGSVTTLEDRKLIVVADRSDFLTRIERVLREIDKEPQQILIEAEILEIALSDDETYGVDWTASRSKGSYGTTGLSDIGSSGFFMQYLTNDLNVLLEALSENGRVRTLSTPKLLVLEDQDAEVIIGDRIGFKVTTTIDSVTSESVEFIESGVILRVKAAVNSSNRIMLDVHPEVSSGQINDGIPSISTTEVTTQLIADDGQPIFIGGLIKNTKTESESGVPVLRSIPLLGALFSRSVERNLKTETIVLIRPHIVSGRLDNPASVESDRANVLGDELRLELQQTLDDPDVNNKLELNSRPDSGGGGGTDYSLSGVGEKSQTAGPMDRPVKPDGKKQDNKNRLFGGGLLGVLALLLFL